MTLQGPVQVELSSSERRVRVAAAGRDAHACGRCGRMLAAAETVWRVPMRVESEWHAQSQMWVAPVCEGCRPWWPDSRRARPCSACGRGVVADADDYWPWPGHTFCSDRCAALWWDQQRITGQAARDAQAGLATCRACGRSLPGKRTTCSVACRQRLYRLRKRQAAETVQPHTPPTLPPSPGANLTTPAPPATPAAPATPPIQSVPLVQPAAPLSVSTAA